jgi:hypothetical protein
MGRTYNTYESQQNCTQNFILKTSRVQIYLPTLLTYLLYITYITLHYLHYLVTYIT